MICVIANNSIVQGKEGKRMKNGVMPSRKALYPTTTTTTFPLLYPIATFTSFTTFPSFTPFPLVYPMRWFFAKSWC